MLSWISVIVNILVASGTLTLAYMAHKSLNESRRVRACEIHTSELKDLIESWRNRLPSVSLPVNPVISPPEPEKYQFEEHRLFPDIQNHTPPEWDILGTWEEFKKKMLKYKEKRYEFFKDILDMSLERTGFNYDPSLSLYESKKGISKFFPQTIYEQLVSWAIGKEKRYNNLQYAERWIEDDKTYIVLIEGVASLFKVSESEKELIDKTKKFHNDIIDNPDKFLEQEQFHEKVDDIVGLKESLEDMRERLAQMLDKLISTPVYYQICEHIKRALHPPSRGKKILSLYDLSIVFYLCAIAAFIIWIYTQFFFSEATTFSVALLSIILAFILTFSGTLLVKIGKIQGE